ncbi:glutaminase [Kangiella sediminilitoris]|uniref:Glutaminase n=1 Tax=Kangiella sediminilitoris TaxID=1144748 RepID=A0A1B3BCI3_9GAMM|nr:glutaminase [Kangiella sediminilitoris]AOE50475.1 Glutaminase [Kangiella sediminilitoris]
MNYQEIFQEISNELKGFDEIGQVATYIPALAKGNPNKFGMYLVTEEGHEYAHGDTEEPFSIQSISKVLSLVYAFKLVGTDLWKRVGVEPSGSPFNSLVQLEYEQGIPRNPLINAGAIVICDILISQLENPYDDFIRFVRELSGNPNIQYREETAASEKECGYKNNAHINLMKSFGNIDNDVEQVLDFYFYLCSIEMSCKDLAQTFMFLARGGKNPLTNKRVLTAQETKRINSIMLLCGFYDEAGEFAFKVGLPGKSGVGGGIVAIYPDQYSIAVWSPGLNSKGNSSKGIKALEIFTTITQSNVFGPMPIFDELEYE